MPAEGHVGAMLEWRRRCAFVGDGGGGGGGIGVVGEVGVQSLALTRTRWSITGLWMDVRV